MWTYTQCTITKRHSINEQRNESLNTDQLHVHVYWLLRYSTIHCVIELNLEIQCNITRGGQRLNLEYLSILYTCMK